jgi:hypothetical protein
MSGVETPLAAGAAILISAGAGASQPAAARGTRRPRAPLLVP